MHATKPHGAAYRRIWPDRALLRGERVEHIRQPAKRHCAKGRRASDRMHEPGVCGCATVH